MITYCTYCGKRMEHKAQEKPNFCQKCGTVLGSCGNTPPPCNTPPSQEKAEEEHDDTEIFAASDIDKLDFELEYDPTNKGVKIQDLVDGTQSSGSKRQSMGKREYNKIKKQSLEIFKKEAGSSRGKQNE